MELKNKKTIGGVALVAILVAGMFTFMPQNASADLTALDKIGTILNIITSIFTEVTNIEEKLDGTRPSLVTNINQTVTNINATVNSPVFGNEEIKNEVRRIEANVTAINATVTAINATLQDKKSFYRASLDTAITADGDWTFLIELDCPAVVPSSNVGFNLEMLAVRVGTDAGENMTIKGIIQNSEVIDTPDIILGTGSFATSFLVESHLVQLGDREFLGLDLEAFETDDFSVSFDASGEKPQACDVSMRLINI